MTTIAQNIVLASDVSSVVQIEQLIDMVCENFYISEDNYGNILIALTEAVNNAIVHGNKLDKAKSVNLSLEASNKEVCFIVKDEGKGFDQTKVPDPTLPENLNKLSGRGVFLMNSLADEVSFDENGTSVKLTFCISTN